MSNDGQILYSFRVTAPDVLERGQGRKVRLEVSRNGELVAPTSGTFTLVDPGGNDVVSGSVVVEDEAATYTIAALDLPETLALSELYQQRWALDMPDGVTRRVRRECAVAPFLLHLPVSEHDLTEGEYPLLVTQLGELGHTLQPFIDEAWRQTLERLWSIGQWPDLMLSTSAFRQPVRQRALFLVFKFLFRQVSGNNRWKELMDHHKDEADAAWGRLNSRIDYDLDGLPDESGRQATGGTIVHRNAHNRRRLRRSPRW